MRTPIIRALRLLVLALVLGAVAIVVPDSQPAPTRFELVKLHTAQAVDAGSRVVWILAVGSDARPGEDMTRSRGDALHLIGIDPVTHAATDIGIPRDSWVDIPGHGHDKINSALYYGGPALLGQTVGNLVGVQPEYVFVSRFKYFIALVRSIGGVTVRNPYAFSDSALKPEGFRRGVIHLGGYDAMAFARIRHSLPRGDFQRSAHQQMVIRAIQRKVHARADQPGFITRGVFDVMKYLATNMPPTELYRFAQLIASVNPGKVTGCVVQGSIGTSSGGASIVLPYVSEARRYGQDARKDARISHC